MSEVWTQIQADPDLSRYFPEGNTYPGRQFTLTVLNVLKPGFIRALLQAHQASKDQGNPVQDNIRLCREAADFLEGSTTDLFYKDLKIGKFLKAGRLWGQRRQRIGRQLDIRIANINTAQRFRRRQNQAEANNPAPEVRRA